VPALTYSPSGRAVRTSLYSPGTGEPDARSRRAGPPATLRHRATPVRLRCAPANTPMYCRSVHAPHLTLSDCGGRLASVATASLRFPASLADQPKLHGWAFATVLLTHVAICARMELPLQPLPWRPLILARRRSFVGRGVRAVRSFTGNCGTFAEYRVSACRIALKIPPSKET
jgi:hypothetical protein